VVILAARERTTPGRALVFGRGAGKSGFSGWSASKRDLDSRLSIPAWTVHDLRRGVATHMGELGILPHVIEATLNHVSGARAGVAGVYNRATLEGEKTTALLRWGEVLTAAIEASPEPQNDSPEGHGTVATLRG
jgi:hypothetical protein